MTHPAPHTSAVSVVAFDFTAKQISDIPTADSHRAMEEGRFVWIDVDLQYAAEARALLDGLGICPPQIIEDAFTRDPATRVVVMTIACIWHSQAVALREHRLDWSVLMW